MRSKAICGAQCSYSGEVLLQVGKVLELAGHKDVKVVVGGWMAPRRVVGVWAWSSPLLLLVLVLVLVLVLQPNQPKVRAAHCSLLLLLLLHAPADEDYNLFI